MRPYTIIALSVSGYASLTGFASLPLFPRAIIRSQEFDNALRYESRYLPITRALSLRTFILQSGELAKAETILEMYSAARRVTGLLC